VQTIVLHSSKWQDNVTQSHVGQLYDALEKRLGGVYSIFQRIEVRGAINLNMDSVGENRMNSKIVKKPKRIGMKNSKWLAI
jgi:hypothetical protein